MVRATITVAVAALIACCTSSIAQAEPFAELQQRSMTVFRENVQPILQHMCFGCHGPKKQEADVRLDTLNPNMAVGADGETWLEALDKLNRGEMPPKKAKQPTDQERETLVNWITAEINRVANERGSTGGRVVMRRLTQYEYQNTMSDLLGIQYDFTDGLPADEKSRDGFRNNGSTMKMTTSQLLHYLETARNGLDRAIVIGGKPTGVVATSVLKKPKGNRNILQLRLYPGTGDKSRKSKTAPPENNTNIKPGDLFPFPKGILRVRVKSRALNDEAQSLGLAIGQEGDKVNELKRVGEVEFRGKQTQEFVFDVQMADYSKPVYALHKGAKLFLLIQVWDANQLPFEETLAWPGQTNRPKNIVIESIEADGPIIDQWPPKSHTQIFIPSPNDGDEAVYAREVITSFMRRAWRRPITQEELDESFKQYQDSREDLEFVPAIKETLASVLTSPKFLFLTEPVLDAKKKEPLSDHELATRLSYFLWSTMPDEKLIQLADSGQLRDSEVLRRTVADMIQDNRAKKFAEHFALQWLNLDLMESIAVNPEYYPDYDRRITQDMRQETLLFFEEILKKDLSILNILESDFTFLNRRLAKHYGVPFPKNKKLGFVRVTLRDEPRRGGVLTHGSVHLVGSNGEDSHAIRRGAWVLDRLLASPPPTPPADVPQLDGSRPELARKSLKEQLALHVKNQACARCHKKIDPFGIAFEHYDATGAWRDKKIVLAKAEQNIAKVKTNRKNRKKNKVKPSSKLPTVAVDASTTLPDGTTIDGIQDLTTYLLAKKKNQFVEGFVRRLLVYSLGRSLEFSDRPAVEKLTTQFRKDGYKMSSLIESIVESDLFQNK